MEHKWLSWFAKAIILYMRLITEENKSLYSLKRKIEELELAIPDN